MTTLPDSRVAEPRSAAPKIVASLVFIMGVIRLLTYKADPLALLALPIVFGISIAAYVILRALGWAIMTVRTPTAERRGVAWVVIGSVAAYAFVTLVRCAALVAVNIGGAPSRALWAFAGPLLAYDAQARSIAAQGCRLPLSLVREILNAEKADPSRPSGGILLFVIGVSAGSGSLKLASSCDDEIAQDLILAHESLRGNLGENPHLHPRICAQLRLDANPRVAAGAALRCPAGVVGR